MRNTLSYLVDIDETCYSLIENAVTSMKHTTCNDRHSYFNEIYNDLYETRHKLKENTLTFHKSYNYCNWKYTTIKYIKFHETFSDLKMKRKLTKKCYTK